MVRRPIQHLYSCTAHQRVNGRVTSSGLPNPKQKTLRLRKTPSEALMCHIPAQWKIVTSIQPEEVGFLDMLGGPRYFQLLSLRIRQRFPYDKHPTAIVPTCVWFLDIKFPHHKHPHPSCLSISVRFLDMKFPHHKHPQPLCVPTYFLFPRHAGCMS